MPGTGTRPSHSRVSPTTAQCSGGAPGRFGQPVTIPAGGVADLGEVNFVPPPKE